MKFEVSISGYGQSGKPVTLQCFYDHSGDVLVVMREVPFIERRTDGFALVTNMELQTRDFLFSDDHIREGIREYFARTGLGTIDIDAAIVRYQPDAKIENDGIDERGPKYRLDPEIGNGQVAIIAAVAFIKSQRPVIDAIGAVDDFTKLYDVLSI